MAAPIIGTRGIVGVVVLLAVRLLAFQDVGIRPGQAIYIAASRDSDLLTMCADARQQQVPGQRAWTPEGRVRIHHLGNRRQVLTFLDSYDSVVLPEPAVASQNRYGIQEGAMSEAVELDRVASDPAIKSSIEQEFRRLNRYKLADSSDKADYVFLAEGVYASVATRTGGTANLTTVNGDVQANVLEAVLAILVPADTYRRDPGNVSALVQAKLWEGSSVFSLRQRETDQVGELESSLTRQRPFAGPGSSRPEPASPASLVRQFHNKERRPRSHPPVCAASGYPLSVGGTDRPTYALQPPLDERPRQSSVPAREEPRRPSGGPTFTAGVTYVSVPVIVTDHEGRFISDLKESDLQVYEEGVQQRVDKMIAVTEPFDVALLVDTSDSMRFTIEDVRKAALAFVAALRPEDRLMPVSFDTRILMWSDLTSDRIRLARSIGRMQKGGGTRLYDAIELVTRERFDEITGRKALVLLTDGVDTRSRLADAQHAFASVSDIPAYVVQYDTSKDTWRLGHPVESGGAYARAVQFLHSVCEGGGGRFYRAGTIENLEQAFSQIARELSGQYTLCYYPSNQKRDGSYRRIRVEVDRQGLEVRARAGYRAPA